ncbi:MAG: hypothetical protein ACLPQ6_00340 [Steroidobacteraceae bacterium]
MRTRLRHLVAVIASCGLLLAATAADDGFETVPDRHPAELLPADMVSGPNFAVVDPVHGDGLMNHFVLDSRFGKFDAYGRAALAIRIREVAALTELAKTSDIQIAADGVVQGVQSEVKTAASVVTHPVKTVTGIPKGIAHLFAGYKARGQEAVADARSDASSVHNQSSDSGDSASPGAGETAHRAADKGEKAAQSYAEHYLGITAAERDYYKKLGVDPYTDNRLLRDTIRRDAKISAAAGFGMKFASLPALPGIGITQRVVDTIYNEDPAAIRERTRKTLAGYGLTAAEVDRFMNAPRLSPTRQVVLLSAAQALDGVAQRAELFRHALGLDSDEEVQVYLRSVGLLVKAHASQPVAAVIAGVRLPAARRADGSVVVCGAFEAVYWTEDVARLDAQLTKALPGSAANAARELWVAGTLSARARAAAHDLGWQLHEVADQSE